MFKQGSCSQLTKYYNAIHGTICNGFVPLINSLWASLLTMSGIASLMMLILLRLTVLYRKSEKYRTRTEEEL